ncbi:MAG: hypothetical protein MI863_01480 [Desulfobacterales bacterium]|nr:hypothetical protein [Desulfobacterales bacterium]
MNIFLGGNPLNRNDDKTVIYSQPQFMPPLTKLESFPKIKKNNVTQFVEHLYFLTMERNGFSYFYPNLETGTNLCRFEWHYDYLGKLYELRLGLSFKVTNSKVTDIGYYVVPHEHYENLEAKRDTFSIDGQEFDKIKTFISNSVNEAVSRIDQKAETAFNILYYIELTSPAVDVIELTENIKILPSRLVNGKVISAIIIHELGHSYLSAKRFSDEKVNLVCAVMSLKIHKVNLTNIQKFPSHIMPVDKPFNLSDVDLNKFYPDTKADIPGIKKHINKEDSDFINATFKAIFTCSCPKTKRTITNMLFSYYSARETEAINKTVALVSYVACLDAIAKLYCSEIRDKNGSRKALVQSIIQLLSLSEQESKIDKWSKRIYNDHRSSYVHGANIRFEEFSQNMDGKNFAGLPKALPVESKPVSKQYEYNSDYEILRKVTLVTLLRYIESTTCVSLKTEGFDEINFSGDSVPEAHVGMVNNGWVKIT